MIFLHCIACKMVMTVYSIATCRYCPNLSRYCLLFTTPIGRILKVTHQGAGFGGDVWCLRLPCYGRRAISRFSPVTGDGADGAPCTGRWPVCSAIYRFAWAPRDETDLRPVFSTACEHRITGSDAWRDTAVRRRRMRGPAGRAMTSRGCTDPRRNIPVPRPRAAATAFDIFNSTLYHCP